MRVELEGSGGDATERVEAPPPGGGMKSLYVLIRPAVF